jgi:hypothetical protein
LRPASPQTGAQVCETFLRIGTELNAFLELCLAIVDAGLPLGQLLGQIGRGNFRDQLAREVQTYQPKQRRRVAHFA